jgi:hypothetical protein
LRDVHAQSAPHRVHRLMQQKRYLTAVNTLNKAITIMFGEDLVGVRGLSAMREQLMDMKETLLETCVGELKAAMVATGAEVVMRDYNSGSESEVRWMACASYIWVVVSCRFLECFANCLRNILVHNPI